MGGMERLCFRYEHNERFDPERDDAEEAGLLTVSVATRRFSGEGTVEASPVSVRAFGESLATYPITAARPLGAAWGYEGRMARVAIRAASVTGTLVVSVEIEDALSGPAGGGAADGVRASFVTDYAQLDAFRRSIAHLVDRRVEAAILRGH
jgi:hypothetical protein